MRASTETKALRTNSPRLQSILAAGELLDCPSKGAESEFST
jgi:hypothetical protein